MKTLAEATDLILQQAQSKFDVTARVRNMEMGTDRILKVQTDENQFLEIMPRERSMQQIGAKLGVPGQFLFRCYEEEPVLAAEIFNIYMKRYQDEKGADFPWLLRTRRQADGGLLLRAALTERYGILDNNQLVDTLSQYFPSDTQVTHFNNNDDFTSLHLRVPGSAETSIGKMYNGEPDKHILTYRISNGETGFYRATVGMGVFRLVCHNGATVPVVKEGALLRQRHFGINSDLFQERLTESVKVGNRVGHIAWEMIRSAQAQQIEHPLVTIERIAKELKLSDSLTDSVKQHYPADPDGTFYGVINAFTSTARDQENVEKRDELERMSARLFRIAHTKTAARYDGPAEEE